MSIIDEGRVSQDPQAQPVVDEFTTVDEIQESVVFNPNNLTDALISVSSRYARFGMLSARARLQRDGFKSRLELLQAKYDKAYRDRFVKNGEKYTEGRLKALVESNPKVVAAKLGLNEATAIYGAIEATKEAIKVQRDAVVQLNKNAQYDHSYTTTLNAGRDKWKEGLTGKS